MENNTNKQDSSSNENRTFDVDVYLIKWFEKIGAWLGKVYDSFKVLFNRPLQTIGALIASLILSFFAAKLVPSMYEVSMTAEVSTVSNVVCYELINDLDHLVSNSSPEYLAAKFECDLEVVESIGHIEMENMISSIDIEDSIVNGMPVRIKMRLKDQAHVDALQELVVSYLENNPYSLKRKELELMRTENLIKKLGEEQIKIDSLKKIAAQSLNIRGNGSGLIYGEPINPIGIYRETIKLFQEQQDLEVHKVLIDNVQVVTGFSAAEEPSFPSKPLLTAVFTFLLFVAYWAWLIKRS